MTSVGAAGITTASLVEHNSLLHELIGAEMHLMRGNSSVLLNAGVVKAVLLFLLNTSALFVAEESLRCRRVAGFL